MLVRDLTIVIPAFNEARRIESTLNAVLAFLPGRFDSSEVLVVDDGSTDGTGELVRTRFGGRVKLIRREHRGGKGAAIRDGVRAAQKSWILFADADLSIPIEEAEKLARSAEIEPAASNVPGARTVPIVPGVRVAHAVPIVIGSKRAPGSEIHYPKLRRMLGGVGQVLISTFVVGGFRDTQCGFKLYRADVAKELFALSRIDGFGFDFEVLMLARRLGYDVREVPVRCEHRVGGTVRPGTYLSVLVEVARVSWNRLLGRYPPRRSRVA